MRFESRKWHACIPHAYSTNYAKLVATICIVAAIKTRAVAWYKVRGFAAHPGFLDLSQLRRASLLKAAVAALLLLFLWMFAIVSEFFTTSMRPVLFPVDRHP